jgi:hypothetical protein
VRARELSDTAGEVRGLGVEALDHDAGAQYDGPA